MANDDKLAEFFNQSLTEEEKVKIETFCKDQVLYGAVKKVLLQAIYVSGTIQKGYKVDPQINGAFSLAALAIGNPIPDAEIGAGVRAQWAGINYLKNGFDSLGEIKAKKDEVKTDEENPAI